MTFLETTELTTAVRRILSDAVDVRCAVAFWGNGSESLLPMESKCKIQLVVNLMAGGTNPAVIEKLNARTNIEILQHDTLHAKVYIGKDCAVVGSANASSNGLGLEGKEQGTWKEAAILVTGSPSVTPIAEWFARIWSESREITPADIKHAMVAWRNRRASKPSLWSIKQLDLTSNDLPFISWWARNSDWSINSSLTENLTDSASEELENRIDESIQIEGPEDRTALIPGTWVLMFGSALNGRPNRRSRLYWLQIGSILDGAFKFRGEKRLRAAALPAANPQAEPFNVSGAEFRKAFFKVIEKDEYNALITHDYEGAWFTSERLKLTRKVWAELQRDLP